MCGKILVLRSTTVMALFSTGGSRSLDTSSTWGTRRSNASSALLSFVVVTVPLLASLFLFACGGGSTPTSPEPRRDALTLLSIEPAQGTSLRIGDSVLITATLRYSFAEASVGSVSVFPYPGDSLPIGLPLFADPFRFAVQGRQGEMTLLSHILMFDDDELQPGPLTVRFILFPEGVDRSQTFVDAHYQLVR